RVGADNAGQAAEARTSIIIITIIITTTDETLAATRIASSLIGPAPPSHSVCHPNVDPTAIAQCPQPQLEQTLASTASTASSKGSPVPPARLDHRASIISRTLPSSMAPTTSPPSHRPERPSLRPSSMSGGSFLRDHEQYKPLTPVGTPPPAPSLQGLLRTPRNRLLAPLPLGHAPPKAASPAAQAKAGQAAQQERQVAAPEAVGVARADERRQQSRQSEKDEQSLVARSPSSSSSPAPAPAPAAAAAAAAAEVSVLDSGVVHSIFTEHESMAAANAPKMIATLFYNGVPSAPAQHGLAAAAGPVTSASSGADKPADLQHLDRYYGPFITQLCLASFLQLVDSLSTPYQRIHSSHRCLDFFRRGDADGKTETAGKGDASRGGNAAGGGDSETGEETPSQAVVEEDRPRVVEVVVSPPPTNEYFTFADMHRHEEIHQFEETWNVQLVLQPESVFRRHKRLAVFDMDSTLIEQEVIDEIAKFIGVEEQVSAITARAMNGELDFTASLQARVALLKGVPATVFDQLKPKIRIAGGAKQLCRALKTLGYKLAVLSGGFQPLAEWLAGELGLDYAFANHLEIDDATQTLTGRLLPTSTHPIISPTRKRELLLHLAETNKVPLAQTMAVGDGANDLPMLHAAGLGVAWNAKQKVQMEAPTKLNGASMVDLLFLLGLGRAEIDELVGAQG
ncbi:hypothetical protein KEM52_003651, partial [Ascosphaera acerosa]